ncbi:hypothetical protein ACFQE7_35380 [Nonomuraea ferruginea]|uniref:hypothetical protein n=1 Tax=Nonomuraea ferruginea TaxID=46174 RepID=UPI00361BBA7C
MHERGSEGVRAPETTMGVEKDPFQNRRSPGEQKTPQSRSEKPDREKKRERRPVRWRRALCHGGGQAACFGVAAPANLTVPGLWTTTFFMFGLSRSMTDRSSNINTASVGRQELT